MDPVSENIDRPPDSPRPPKLLEQLRAHLRTRHYSIRTEEAHIDWVRRFILYHNKRHPQSMGAAEVGAFLSYLAVQRQVSASTQSQAKAAVLYLYRQELGVSVGVSVAGAVNGPAPRRAHGPSAGAAPPHLSRVGAARGERGSQAGADCQAGHAARAAPFVCHAFAADGL